MSWYKTGTVTVTNGSATVTGAGTLFVGAVSAGDAFVGPNGQVYEVTAVISATQITISPVYLGGSQPGATYGIFPTYAALVSFNTRLNALLVNYESVLTGAGAGKFLNGTAAAPGISFVGDTDTGIRWVSANCFALVTGGADRVVVSNTALEVKVPIVGAAVTQSLVDQVAGRLVRVKDYGLGGSIPLVDNDFNTAVMTANYSAAGVAWVNGPPQVANTTGIALRVDQLQNSSNGVQTAHATNAGRTFRRYFAGGSFGSWFEIYHAGNIVGTVANTGGVNTGAAFEFGFTASGYYQKTADGHMKCWGRFTSNTTTETDVVFPASFASGVDLSLVFGTVSGAAFSLEAKASATSTTGFSASARRGDTSARTAALVHWSCDGRWS